jgi:hypothetical protein
LLAEAAGAEAGSIAEFPSPDITAGSNQQGKEIERDIENS